MKKLFTSLLLLGAAAASQAQVTVTGYNASESTVTINFTYDGARPTPQKVEDAIKAAFEGPESTYNVPDPQRKQIKTIILTGDWKNVDIAPDNNGGNNSIAKIIEKFSDDNHYSTLDLSACQGFESTYVSVRDYYGTGSPHAGQTFANRTLADGDDEGYTVDGYADGFTSDRLETDFTTLPVPQGLASTTVPHTSIVTVTQNSKEVTQSVSYYLYSQDNPITFVTDADGNVVSDSWTPNPLPQGFLYIEKRDDGYYVVKDQNNSAKLGESISYTYVDDNGNTQNVPQDQVNNLRSEDGKLWYDFTLYKYEDENGSVATTSTTTPHQLQSDGNNGYIYNYNETVYAFAIHKDTKIDGIIFPVSDNFTFIPNDLFKDNTKLKRAVLSNKIVAIGNKAFGGCLVLEEVNFPSTIQEIGYGAFKKVQKLPSANLSACTNLSRIRFETFQECFNLTEVTFPANIREIQKEAFEKCALVEVDLRNCHELRRLAGLCFNNMKNAEGKYSLINVYLCSHEKIIRGTSGMNQGDSNGAFALCNNIKRVEIVGCENTCVTECVCENRAFEWDITHYQTAAPSNVYDEVAELIYPNNLPACDNSGYTSSFDFFEGDYKAGTMITQETLLCYYRQIPNTGSGSGKFVWLEPDPNNPDQMVKKEENRTVTADNRYIGNGWLEFIKTGSTTVVPKGEFLRTYSRTAGDGPCMLPSDITAYRAVDYKSNAVGWVLDRNRKTGTHYLKEDATDDMTDDNNYVLITPDTDPADYANRPLYSKVTTGGKLYLRPLVAKVAYYNINGRVIEGYTEDTKDDFDSEEIYSKLQRAEFSYVPENTGVVLYSEIDEKSFLVLSGDFGTKYVYKEFPHTGDRFEEGRLSSNNTDDDINMLSGSFDTGVPVAPVFPWVYTNKEQCTGGNYTSNKEYRNFAVVRIEENGGSVIDDRYRWKRLQPSKMKVNRAFAQIPVNRFDNWNETVDQMPDFTIDDEVEGSSNSNLMLISVFEDEELNGETDGIEEIGTAGTAVAKTNDNAWYTIQGVRVAQPTKGVYIHNGKKVVIN